MHRSGPSSLHTYNKICPGSIQPRSTRKAFIKEDTKYKKHCTLDSDTSVLFEVGTLGPHTVLPASLPLFKTLQNPLLESPSAASYFLESHRLSEISSLSKVILVLGKLRSLRVPNLCCRGAESPGWFEVLPKNCTRHDARVGTLWWSFQSPVAHSCSLFVVLHLSIDEEHIGSTPYRPIVWSRVAYLWGTAPSQSKKTVKLVLVLLWIAATPSSGVEKQETSIGTTGLSFPDHSHRPTIHLQLWPSWGNLVHWSWLMNQVISNCSTIFLLPW